MNTFTCFGEVLWDLFPDHKTIGGAPLNVALRLKSFNNDTAIISGIGKDELGTKILAFLDQRNLNAEHVQINKSFETGQVKVTLDGSGSASYTIEEPVAWDKIKLEQDDIDRVEKSNVFIYGSLACRNEVSRTTLLELLNHASFKVFDVNLRPPFYSYELLFELMMKADFIKFNDEELKLITRNLKSGYRSIEENMKYVSKEFNAKYVCVTKGSKGATLLFDGVFYNNSGYKITVKDTVGAGDSFLATLIHKITNKCHLQECIDFASAVGAFVASSKGANPTIDKTEISNILKR